MADYTQITDFSAKDALSTGDPEKLILGSDVDGEFSAIATAVSSKYDSTDLASQAQAEAETVNTVLMTPLRVAQWADANGGIVGDLQALTTAGFSAADALLGYDHSATAAVPFTLSTGLTFSGTVVTLNSKLQDITALAVTDGNIMVGNGSTWVAESGATARTSLGLGSLATASTINDDNWSGTDLAVGNGGTGSSTASAARTALGVAIGSDVQAYDADLAAIAGLAKTNSNFIVGNGSTWVAEGATTARTSLGVGTGDSPQFTAINLGHASDTTITRDSAGKIAVEGKSVIKHTSATYNSGEVTFSTSAASGGSSGDLWFKYTA